MRQSEGRDINEFVRWALSEASGAVLDARESRVIALRYDSSARAQRTLGEVGLVLGISPQRVRQIQATAHHRFQTCHRERRMAEFVRWAVSPEGGRILKPRESHVIALRYDSSGRAQQTLAAVGRVLGVSRERVRQIEAKAYDKLRKCREQERVIELLQMKVTALSLTPPAKRALRRAGIADLRTLGSMSHEELVMRLPYPLGRRVADEVGRTLEGLGLPLAKGAISDRTPIELLVLPQRAYGALKRGRYWSVEELEGVSDAELLARVPQFGVKSLEVVRHSIARLRRDSLPCR